MNGIQVDNPSFDLVFLRLRMHSHSHGLHGLTTSTIPLSSLGITALAPAAPPKRIEHHSVYHPEEQKIKEEDGRPVAYSLSFHFVLRRLIAMASMDCDHVDTARCASVLPTQPPPLYCCRCCPLPSARQPPPLTSSLWAHNKRPDKSHDSTGFL